MGIAVQGVIYFKSRKIKYFTKNMANHLLMVGLILLIGSTTILSQNDDEDCPFTNGSCPVTLDNVVDVFFHDIADRISCQRECRLIDECKFFTMYGVNDDPTDHMKCLLFKLVIIWKHVMNVLLDLNYLSLMTPTALILMVTSPVKLHLTMLLMSSILMLLIHSLAKINVECWMIATFGPFLML